MEIVLFYILSLLFWVPFFPFEAKFGCGGWGVITFETKVKLNVYILS